MGSLRKRRIALGSLFFLAGMCFSSWASRIPDFQQKFNLSEGKLGTLLLGMPIGSLVALPLAAWAVHRFGSRIVIIIGSISYLLFLLGLGWVGSGFQLGLLVIVFGLIGNIMNISLNTQALGLEEKYGRSILGSFHGLWSLAGFSGAGFGALMVYFDFVPFQHYIFVAGLGLVLLLLSQKFILKEIKTSSGGFVFRKPDDLLLRVGLIGFFGMMCEGCMFDWSGVYLSKVAMAKKQYIPLGFVAFMGAMAAGRFLADRLANKWGRISLLQSSGGLIFSGLSLSVFFPNLVTAVVGFLMVGLGTAAVIPISYSIAGRSKLYSPGVALALVSTISFFGFLSGPPLIGFIAEIANLQVSFAIIAVMGACITVLASIRQAVFQVKIVSPKQ